MVQKLLLIILIISPLLSFNQEKELAFEVSFKGKVIGNLFAKEIIKGDKVIKDLRTDTKVNLIAFSVHVESEVTEIKENGVLIKSKSYRNANRGTEDIVSQIERIKPKTYQVKRNGKEFKIEGKEITYCIVDLYFIEPKNVKDVFSDMYAEFLTIEKIGPHKYKLISPKSKDTYYSYENGDLVEIKVETKVGMAISKRIK